MACNWRVPSVTHGNVFDAAGLAATVAHHEEREWSLSMRVTVIGAGVIGLCCAIDAAEAGHKVTVVATETTPSTNSDSAGAIWLPLLNGDNTQVPATYESDIARWARRSFARLEALVGRTGVRYVLDHELFRTSEQPPDYLVELLPDLDATEDDRLPSDFTFRWSFTTFAIEVPVFMRWLIRRVNELGIPFRRRTLSSLLELSRRDQDVVINCAGLGARDLVPDPTVRPVKGQLLIHDPIPCDIALGSYDFSALPRTDALVLGALFQEQFDDVEPTEDETGQIWDEVSRWEQTVEGGVGLPRGVLDRARVRRVVSGLRPFRGPGIRLELDCPDGVPIIHNYGHGASGFTLCWGCAESALDLVNSL